MLGNHIEPDMASPPPERAWGRPLFDQRKADHIRRRPPTWWRKTGVALGSFAMLTFAAQPVIDLQLERIDRERITAKYQLLANFGFSRSTVDDKLRGTDRDLLDAFYDMLSKYGNGKGEVTERLTQELNAPTLSYNGGIEITWDDLRLLSTPTSDPTLETFVSKVYERLAGEFMSTSLSKNIPLPENFTLGATGYTLCGTGPGGSHSSNGCHACVASNNGDSERNRRFLSKLLRRLARKSPDARLRVFAKGVGDTDMDVFATAWFAKWPEIPRQQLLKETTDLDDAAKSLGITFDAKEHLLNRVIEIAINQIAMRKQSHDATITFVPILPIVIQQAEILPPTPLPA